MTAQGERDADGLTAAERRVLGAMASPEPPNGVQVGKSLGISKQRVQQITASLQLRGYLLRKEVLVFSTKGAQANANTPGSSDE